MTTRRLLALTLVMALPACSPSCYLKPDEAFDEAKTPSAPDYTKPASWAALPDSKDLADLTPPGAEDAQAAAEFDVFFIHPTTYLSKSGWNAPMSSGAANESVDQAVLPGQASAFNGCCKVYAPRYRQATLGAYMGELEDQKKAFELAYSDVERAFDTYLSAHNEGRPFIVASHSQGAMHAMRLLQKVDSDDALRERFVAGYVVGYMLPMNLYDEVYEHLVPCDTPEQTGCVVAWDTYGEGVDIPNRVGAIHWVGDALKVSPPEIPMQCTNPISWKDHATKTPTSAHKGIVQRINEGEDRSLSSIRRDEPAGMKVTGLSEPIAQTFTAQCKEGALRITPDAEDIEGLRLVNFGEKNYHIHDYGFFYMDIRANAIARTKAWRSP